MLRIRWKRVLLAILVVFLLSRSRHIAEFINETQLGEAWSRAAPGVRLMALVIAVFLVLALMIKVLRK